MSKRVEPRSRFLPGVLVGLILAGVFGVLLLAPLLLTRHAPLPLEEAYGATVVNLTTRLLSSGVGANPYAGDARAVRSARDAYGGSCSQCHGPAGNGRGLFGPATYPAATDLTSPSTRALDDAQLFYIVKNGLGFTAMPAYADQYGDREIWGLVAYIRSAQAGQAPAIAVQGSGSATGGNPSRGAAVYMAQGCATCHGPIAGQAEIKLEAREIQEAVRRGRPGMPKYTTGQLSDAELADLVSLGGSTSGRGEGQGTDQQRNGRDPRNQGDDD